MVLDSSPGPPVSFRAFSQPFAWICTYNASVGLGDWGRLTHTNGMYQQRNVYSWKHNITECVTWRLMPRRVEVRVGDRWIMITKGNPWTIVRIHDMTLYDCVQLVSHNYIHTLHHLVHYHPLCILWASTQIDHMPWCSALTYYIAVSHYSGYHSYNNIIIDV